MNALAAAVLGYAIGSVADTPKSGESRWSPRLFNVGMAVIGVLVYRRTGRLV